jgi:hypothetical protein
LSVVERRVFVLILVELPAERLKSTIGLVRAAAKSKSKQRIREAATSKRRFGRRRTLRGGH